ncbi:uncharacterized protein [Choristoneura fumiferana]|uniref:uncharacterized protein n=1 Tax=Choristoneura fumiferana TaxID=7141 RepID=UPI003D15362B
MVAYCCVKGCTNNSSNKKKDPNDITSFHAFPTNIELKQKWVRAIGRPNWAPPSYARVCSAHFSYEQINHDGRRIRIKDDALPVKDLPANSNFEASHVEVCRFCLAADLKMYSLLSGVHRVYMDSLAGYKENCTIEGLPQFVCYECAAHLRRCYNLIEKSMIAQATLLDIFAHNGKITKNLVKQENRKELNLISSLGIQEISRNQVEFKDDSEIVNIDNIQNDDENSSSQAVVNFININIPKIEATNFTHTQPEDIDEIDNYNEMDTNFHDENDTTDDKSECSIDEMSCTENLNLDAEFKPKVVRIIHEEEETRTLKKTVKKSSKEGLTPDEVEMQKYFTIVKLTLKQQIEEWNKTRANTESSGETLKCQICSKLFAHHNTYQLHILRHEPSRGKAECTVCKLRFKNEVLAKSHANRTHGKKFYCRTCPKAFNNVGVAKKHHKWHAGHVYACGSCSFASAHASALGAHARSQHAGAHACAACGHAFVSARGLALHAATVHQDKPDQEESLLYRCEQCDLSFKTEGARRVHMLTSKQHKKNTSLCDSTPQDPSLKNSCNKCGVEFPTLKQLVEHGKAEHGRARKKTSWSLPGDSYPTQCEHCGVVVNSRSQHWRHVSRVHPAARRSYRPVVTAVCHACGKGFQNSTKLQLHLLRHAPPSVPCAQCGRAFHDKYALARHAAAHAHARPHRCHACPRAFKQRGNLARHYRVHTGVTPYECSMCGKKFKYSTSRNLHVRTVHYKLPHPPRKRRGKARADGCDTEAK